MRIGIRQQPGNQRRRRAGSVVRAHLLALIACLSLTTTACIFPPFLPNPEPVEASYRTVSVGGGYGFTAATIFYPAAEAGPYPAVALAPGNGGTRGSLEGWGAFLARQGYVAITIDTLTLYDLPLGRGLQLLAALDYVNSSWSSSHLVDRNRQAVMGHSMGGGGALNAASLRPSLKAAVPMAPWAEAPIFSLNTVPTLLIACENDETAWGPYHVSPIYESMALARITSAAYVEVANGTHNCPEWSVPTDTDGPQGGVLKEAVIKWLDRFVQGDTSILVCPPVPTGGVISETRASCR